MAQRERRPSPSHPQMLGTCAHELQRCRMVDEHGSPLEGWFRPRPEVLWPLHAHHLPAPRPSHCGRARPGPTPTTLRSATLRTHTASILVTKGRACLRAQTAPADPAIDEIHRDEHCPGIFIGGIGAARNFAGLNAHGIKSVLDVAAGDPREQAGCVLCTSPHPPRPVFYSLSRGVAACMRAPVCVRRRPRAPGHRLELPAVAEHGTAARALAANTAVRRVEEVCAAYSQVACCAMCAGLRCEWEVCETWAVGVVCVGATGRCVRRGLWAHVCDTRQLQLRSCISVTRPRTRMRKATSSKQRLFSSNRWCVCACVQLPKPAAPASRLMRAHQI